MRLDAVVAIAAIAVIAVAAVLVACGGTSAPTKQAEPAVPAAPPSIDQLRADACACADAGCASTIGETLGARRDAFAAEVATAAACLPGWTDPAEVVLRRVQAFRDEVCACAGEPCIRAAQRSVMEWMAAHEEEFEDVVPSAEQRARADALDAESRACRERVVAGDGRPAAPAPTVATMSIELTREAACACTDLACRERLGMELDAQRERFEHAAREAQRCLDGAGAGTPPPPSP